MLAARSRNRPSFLKALRRLQDSGASRFRVYNLGFRVLGSGSGFRVLRLRFYRVYYRVEICRHRLAHRSWWQSGKHAPWTLRRVLALHTPHRAPGQLRMYCEYTTSTEAETLQEALAQMAHFLRCARQRSVHACLLNARVKKRFGKHR